MRNLISLACLVILAGPASARLTGNNPTSLSQQDTFAVGKTSAEVVVDYLGNFSPTVTNSQALGSSGLKWANLETTAISTSGASISIPTAAGNAASVGTAGTVVNGAQVSGSNTAASQLKNAGLQVYSAVALTGIVTSTSIPVAASYITLMSTANTTVNITAIPSISTTTVPRGTTELPGGTYIVLSSTGASGVILTDEGTLTGSRLQLGAATRTVTQHKTLTLIYDAVQHFWLEVSFGNN